MSQRLTGADVPYFRTVPSSPSNDDDGLADEDEPTDHQSPLAQQQNVTQIVEDDEETILRRRLLEKKLEKEKTKATIVQQTKERDGTTEQRTKDSAGKDQEQKEKPKREKIVWDIEKVADNKSSSRSVQTTSATAADTSRSHDLKPSSSSSAVSSSHHRRRDETTAIAYEHRHHRRRDEQQPTKRGGSETLSRDHYHHKKHRHRKHDTTGSGSSEEHRRDKDQPKSANADQKRKDRVTTGGGGEQRSRTALTTTAAAKTTAAVEEVIAATSSVDEAGLTATTRKRRHHQLGEEAKATTADAEPFSLSPGSKPMETASVVAEQHQQQREDGEEDEDNEEEEHGRGGDGNDGKKKSSRTETEKKKPVEKRKKFSKFESSPEEEEEEDEEEEESFPSGEDEDEEEREKEEKQRMEGGGKGGAGEQHQRQLSTTSDQELIMEEYFGMDERYFRSRAGTVDTEMNGANGEEENDDAMDIGDDDELIENKEFDQLTEEEKALLSPEMLTQKEEKYQRRLVSMLPVYYPGISGCRSVAEYECLNKISEGTFGVVYRAQNKRTDEIVALKRLKMEKEHQGFPITSLREINMLLKCGAHPNVVNVREVVVGSSMDKIYLVMDFVEHDVKALIELMKSRGKKWTIPQVKTLLRQLIAGVLYMHDQYVIHRDLKTSNLLLSHQGILKIGDFGLAREFGDPIKPYTPVVVTLWYRAPELLLGTKLYSTPIDMWSVGCIFAEFLKLEPLFPGRTEIDQMQKIFKEVGTPNEQIWPGCMELPGMKTGVFADTPYNQLRKKFAAELPDDDGFELLNKLLTLNPSKRLDAETAVVSKWFNNDPKPAHPSTFPTWPAKSEQNRRPLKEPSVGGAGGRAQQQQPPRPAGGFTLRFDAPKF